MEDEKSRWRIRNQNGGLKIKMEDKKSRFVRIRTHDGGRKIIMKNKNHPGGYDIRIKKTDGK